MELVLVSACLVGQAVRYDGGDKLCQHNILKKWIEQKRVIIVCPEVAGGLSVPRLASEIVNGAGGLKVLAGLSKVIDSSAKDVTQEFINEAKIALDLAKSKSIRVAVLKENSPSCGTNFIYDGTFTAIKVANSGVTSALLQQSGIHVFNENQLDEADSLLKQFEAGSIIKSS